MSAALVAAATLGLSGGLSPGPLLTLVVAETLARGRRSGLAVAAAPLLTDGPIIAATWFLVGRVAADPHLLGVISLVGAGFVAWLGLDGLRCSGLRADPVGAAPSALRRSLMRGVGVNLLNPHPYLFWLTVGSPMLHRAASEAPWIPVMMLVLFYLGLVGSKCVLALLVARSRAAFRGGLYLWTMRVLGAVLVVFAVVLASEGLALLRSVGPPGLLSS